MVTVVPTLSHVSLSRKNLIEFESTILSWYFTVWNLCDLKHFLAFTKVWTYKIGLSWIFVRHFLKWGEKWAKLNKIPCVDKILPAEADFGLWCSRKFIPEKVSVCENFFQWSICTRFWSHELLVNGSFCQTLSPSWILKTIFYSERYLQPM